MTRNESAASPIVSSMSREIWDSDPSPYLQVHQLWEKGAAGRFAPDWHDLDLVADVPKFIQFFVVTDILSDGDHRFRLCGSGHVKHHGEDLTGRLLSEDKNQWRREHLENDYAAVVALRQPRVFEVTYEDVMEPVLVYRAPLSRDGEHVTGVLSFLFRDDTSPKISAWYFRY